MLGRESVLDKFGLDGITGWIAKGRKPPQGSMKEQRTSKGPKMGTKKQQQPAEQLVHLGFVVLREEVGLLQ